MPIQEIRRPFRMLLIEDTLDDERLALRALRACGLPLAVRVAREGLRAQEALGLGGAPDQDGDADFDLVVSDLKLPGLDGHRLLCLARGEPRLAHIPYVLFSSSNDASDVRRCLDGGADAFAQKPVSYQEYLDCLQEVVRWALGGFDPTDSPPCVLARPEPYPRDRRAV